jgi:propanediol dehydratase large subunit
MKIKSWRLAVMIVPALAIIMLAGVLTPARTAEPVEQQNLVDMALVTFRAFMVDKEMDWFRDNLKDVKALLIIPSLI